MRVCRAVAAPGRITLPASCVDPVLDRVKIWPQSDSDGASDAAEEPSGKCQRVSSNCDQKTRKEKHKGTMACRAHVYQPVSP